MRDPERSLKGSGSLLFETRLMLDGMDGHVPSGGDVGWVLEDVVVGGLVLVVDGPGP